MIRSITLTYFYKNKSNATSIDPTVHPSMDRRSNDKDLESKLDILSNAVLSLNRKVRIIPFIVLSSSVV